ncbi:MAG: ankyrin repeat domain-containing protein, partial [Gammaproteobacteria bacterium]|nr:ankyrin repeat domain-containing protein [Gammaproteobacteria bacterium]
MERYEKGYLSRRDLAFTLNQQISKFPEKNEELISKLKAYLEENPLRSIYPLSSKEDINNKINDRGQTLLELACYEGNLELVQNLLNAGANPNAEDKDGYTPLLAAIKYGHIEVVQTLLDNGANPKKWNSKTFRTPITEAKFTGQDKIVSLLNQQVSINPIILSSHLENSDPVAIKISKLFVTYAHPPLFSLHWRNHRVLASKIAQELKKTPQKSAAE